MTSLIKFFIERPFVVNMLMAFFIFTGICGMLSAKYNTYPDVDTGIISIETAFPGAGPEDVELTITEPLERELLHVDGVDKIISTSMEGLSSIQVICNASDSMSKYDLVEKDIHNAIDRAMASMPSNLPGKPQVLRPEKSKNFPLMQILLTGAVPEETLRTTARSLRLELRGIPGVSGVSLSGYRDREVRVMLDETKIRQLGLSYEAVIEAVNRRNVRRSGGSLESVAGEQDVLTIGKFKDPKDIQDVILFEGEPGDIVRIKDVARLLYDYADPLVRSRINGNTAIVLSPKGEELADKLGAAERIKAFIEQKNQLLPTNMQLVVVNDSSKLTTNMLDVLIGNALAGIVLVFFVLLAFFELRFTIWVALGIPTSIFMVFTLLPVLGISVNILSMSALILMLGILVDDAVVVAESIFRYREYGHGPNEAALIGVQKVMVPVFASAITTVVTLAPMAFLGGIQGKIMWVIPVMAILVLAMSLFECKFILPSHIAHSFSDKKQSCLSRPWFEWVEQQYEALMMKVVPRRYAFMLGAVIVFSVLAYISAKTVVIAISPKSDTDIIFVKAEAPVGTSLLGMEQLLLGLEKDVRAVVPDEALDNIVVTAGHHDHNNRKVTEGRDLAWGIISVYLKPANDREVNSLDLQVDLRERLLEKQQFKRLNVIVESLGPSMGWPLEAVVIGNGDDRFIVADLIADYVKTIEGVTDSWSSYVAGKPVISLRPDYEALSRYGLTVGDISTAVKIAYSGQIIDQFETIDENIGYRLMLDGLDMADPASLYSLTVTSASGKLISLRSLVEFEQQPGEGTIRHFLGDRATTIYADIDRTIIGLSELNASVAKFVEEKNIYQEYPEVTVYFDGEMVTSAEQGGSAAKAFFIALVSIVFILVLLFRSALQPLMVITLIPLGVIGVFFVFSLHGLEMSMTGLIGIAGLMGVIVNDALVMLDRFNTERALHGKNEPMLLHDRQIVECASIRLRPIVITTVTTFAGLFPAAYGLSGSYDLITPMIMVMLWGVLLASITTLFLLPCLYAMERDLIKFFRKDIAMQKLDNVIMYN